jgi:hypothetical protein
MRTNRTCPLILSVVLLTISWTGAVIAEEPIQAENTELWDIVEDAYIYCYPLVVVDATLKKFTNTEIPTPTQAPINQLAHSNFCLRQITDLLYHQTLMTFIQVPFWTFMILLLFL